MAGFNLNWLFNDKEDAELNKKNEQIDRRLDPLETDRKSIRTQELPLIDEEITEEEMRLLENDPEAVYMQKLFSDYNAKADFYRFVDPELFEEISNDEGLDYTQYNYADDTSYDLNGEEWQQKQTSNEEDEIPFEERDIMAERLKPYRDANENKFQEEKREHDDNLDYTLTEFKLMEDAYKFKTLVNKETQDLLEKERPISMETRQPITESELEATLKKYYDIKKKGNYRDFGQRELNFMKQCSNWNRINREAGKRAKNPVMANGQVLTEKQINDLVEEYNELRDEKPEEFAELKYEDHKWEKGNFNWQEEEFKGGKQYAHYGKEVIAGPDGKKQTIVVKYILKNPPLGFESAKQNQENVYYTVGTELSIKNSKIDKIKFVDLKRPYPFKETKAKKAA